MTKVREPRWSAFGLKAGLGARIVSGYNLVKAWIGLDEKFSQADWVITGEGRFDESSLHGKRAGSTFSRGNRQGQAAIGYGRQHWPNPGMPNSPTVH